MISEEGQGPGYVGERASEIITTFKLVQCRQKRHRLAWKRLDSALHIPYLPCSSFVVIFGTVKLSLPDTGAIRFVVHGQEGLPMMTRSLQPELWNTLSDEACVLRSTYARTPEINTKGIERNYHYSKCDSTAYLDPSVHSYIYNLCSCDSTNAFHYQFVSLPAPPSVLPTGASSP